MDFAPFIIRMMVELESLIYYYDVKLSREAILSSVNISITVLIT